MSDLDLLYEACGYGTANRDALDRLIAERDRLQRIIAELNLRGLLTPEGVLFLRASANDERVM